MLHAKQQSSAASATGRPSSGEATDQYASAYALLVTRWKIAIAVVLLGTVVAAIADGFMYSDRLPPLLVVFVVQLAAIAAFWHAVVNGRPQPRAFTIALGGVITHCVLTGISGIFRGNVEETIAFEVVICMSAGTLLPLGVRRQALAAAVAAAVSLAVASMLGGTGIGPVLTAPGALPVILGFGVSICAAYELERYRLVNERQAVATRWRSAALEATADGVLITGADGRIIWVNPAFTALTGYGIEELAGRTPQVLKSGCQDEPFYRELWQTIVSGGVWHGALVNRRKDGSLYFEEQTITPMRDQTGAISHFLSVRQDITTRRQAEDALRQSQQAAERANQAKSEFVAHLSHEIRTPMNGIIGMAQLALETPLSPEQREYLEVIKSSAEWLLVLINDVLDLAKMEAGKLEIERLEFRLRDALDAIVKLLAVRATQKQLRMRCEIGPAVPERLLGDPTRLRQVVVNLLANAIKFTDSGEVVLRADCDGGRSDGLEVRFAVSDTGIGIPADQLQTIFEAFEQAGNSAARRAEGSGLGLAIAAKLVRLMGGSMWVESAVGHGSTFHFTARFGAVAVPDGSEASSGAGRAALAPAAAVPARALRVLLVEDNPVSQKLVVRLLEKNGYEITAADNGKEAVAAWSRARHDVVLMDVQMPEMDGFAATAAIRKLEEATGTHVPIIAMTANAMSGDEQRCLNAGMDGYVPKPVSFKDLLRLLEGIVRAQ